MIEVKEKITDFVESIENAKKKLEELREVIKKEVSDEITIKISNEELKEANDLIAELQFFLKIQFESNVGTIQDYAKALMEGKKENLSQIMNRDTLSVVEDDEEKIGIIERQALENPALEKKEETLIKKIEKKEEDLEVKRMPSFKQFNEFSQELNEMELRMLKDIGTEGYFDQRQIKKGTESHVIGLNFKGYLEIQEKEVGGKKILNFELNKKGQEYFKNVFNEEPRKNQKERIMNEQGDIEKGLLLYTAQEEFRKRGYEIESSSISRMEISKDRVTTYLMPDYGEYSYEEYEKILNRTNQLKKIGFLCENQEIKFEAKQAVEKWAKRNPDKINFLKVYFTDMQKLKEEELFDIVKY